ncbi:short-chain dehydrogenase [Bacillus sp. J14TS2]|uniref:SDR family oxidoreductase n=1 Tax=Bacillus sp. J14TS2 TaxID=2807188 RepID=UPI001B01F809|nr:SDR family oxidoreductase [Bacillus sp. J14TS2]GIN72911.1 short-chain dehydrogenase [Bacillus sp. J14TS2]
MKPLEGKIAVVTGASRGIGRAIALRLAKDGALVSVHYAKNEEAANETVQEIEATGGQAFAIQYPFELASNMQAFFEKLDSKLQAITGNTTFDILVNNAGISYMGTIEDISEEAFDQVMAVNLKSPFFLTQLALNRLRNEGRIINISSASTQNNFPGTLIYNLSKAGLNTLTQNLAKQLGTRGITVNALLPGVVETEINAERLKNPEDKKYAAQSSVFNRLGQVEDIADVVAFFASPDSRWVTGQIVDTSGGGTL